MTTAANPIAPGDLAVPHPHDAPFRNQVLEMLVAGAALGDILETLLHGLEQLRPGALCSLMLLDAQGQHFVRIFGPSLPAFYSAALQGLAIGPGVGSCGTAAHTRERVIVEDIASHPYWAPYRELAAQAGVAACWSQPILSVAGEVLGTFATYYRHPQTPDAADLAQIQQSAALACIAIEKDAEARKLRDSEERYRTLVEWLPDPVVVHRMGTILYVNPSAMRTFGAIHASDLLGRDTQTLIHPDCQVQQRNRMHALLQGQAIEPMVESRFLRLDGTAFDVEVQGTQILFEEQPAIHVVLRDISRRKQAELALHESQERFRALVEYLPMAIVVHRAQTVVYANPAAARTLGAASVEALLGRSVMDLTHPDYRQRARERIKAREEGRQDVRNMELKLLRLDGVAIDVQMTATLIRYAGSNAVQASFTDITDSKLVQDRLQLAASVFSHAREGIAITGADGHIVDANATYCAITGQTRLQVLGTQPGVFEIGTHAQAYFETLWQALREQGHWSGEIDSQRPDGQAYAAMVTISSVKDTWGTVRNYVVLVADITSTRNYQKQLETMAHFDALTQLPNRLLLADRLHQAMRHSQRRAQSLAVVFLDLDGFKAVNDQHGHSRGDELLVAVSQRMKAALRDGDTLARMGGDEFVAVLVDLQQAKDAEPVLVRLLRACAEPVAVGAHPLQVSVSMGIAVYPRDGTHADLLLRRADQAMYQAKQAGRNRYQFFSGGDASTA